MTFAERALYHQIHLAAPASTGVIVGPAPRL